MKTCSSCSQSKPLSDFYKHSGMLDGYLNKCKVCVRGRVATYKLLHLDSVREYDRNRPNHEARIVANRVRRSTGRYVASKKDSVKKWNSNNMHKRSAHRDVRKALLSGKLIKEDCMVCGCADTEAHHDDYSKPLEVLWLCDAHHKARHRHLNELRRRQDG